MQLVQGGSEACEKASLARRTPERRALLRLLRSGDVDAVVAELRGSPGRRYLGALRPALCGDESVKWRAVTAIGALTAELADRDLESARVVMRTLIWSLTEESGGIAWGVPDSMGEILAAHERLAHEYAPILVSYMREDGNFLEYEPLQRGLIWGVGRLAEVRPGLLRDNEAGRYLMPYLRSGDATVRGFAAWALGGIGAKQARSGLQALLADREEIRIYLDRELVTSSVGELARQALARILEDCPLDEQLTSGC